MLVSVIPIALLMVALMVASLTGISQWGSIIAVTQHQLTIMRAFVNEDWGGEERGGRVGGETQTLSPPTQAISSMS